MKNRSNSRQRDPESGYTLLIALLLVATILLITAAAAPNIFTEGRRERDEEMIWRGQQYTRAIGLYYKKYGHYPHTVDDLVKSDTQIRFLRKAYKDPMNSEDGSWRFIYLGPGGVLINSVMYVNIAQVGAGGAFASGTGTGTGGGATGSPGATNSTDTTFGATPGTPPGTATGATDSGDDSQSEQNQSDVIGGNLVGVGSKVKKPSIKVYNGGTTYYQWEFIWKPQQGLLGGAAGATTPASGAAGAASGPAGNSSAPTNSPMPGGTTPDQGQSPPPTPGP
jgi:type II secretory pathway pseudopilin PulG